MSDMGWIKLHRKLAKWEWYGDPNVVLVFVDILLHTNFKHTKWRGIDLAPGQLVWGRKAAADRIGISERNVRTAINKLKSTSEVTIKTTNKYSIVTVLNWKLHQATDQQSANERPASDQQVTTDKEGNNQRTRELEDLDAALAAYQSLADKKNLPKVRSLTDTRRKKLKARLKTHGLDGWNEALKIVGETPFLLGDNDRKWTADMDFLLTESKFVKVLEGGYGQQKPQRKGSLI